jgi:hypothetical protein
MIQIIAGEKGKGKTKIILGKVNEEVQTIKGNIVYLDKSNKHMYELSNRVRLINVKDFLVENFNEFLGFICGILSQDSDVEKIYVDSFIKVACMTENNLEPVLTKLEQISDTFHVDFVLSISRNKEELSERLQEQVIVSL